MYSKPLTLKKLIQSHADKAKGTLHFSQLSCPFPFSFPFLTLKGLESDTHGPDPDG